VTSFYHLPWLTEKQHTLLVACVGFALDDVSDTGGSIIASERVSGETTEGGHHAILSLHAFLEARTIETQTPCVHVEHYKGHCGEMPCYNYIQKCPRHGLYGEPTNPCNHERTPTP
jgi:hypothetical protein